MSYMDYILEKAQFVSLEDLENNFIVEDAIDLPINSFELDESSYILNEFKMGKMKIENEAELKQVLNNAVKVGKKKIAKKGYIPLKSKEELKNLGVIVRSKLTDKKSTLYVSVPVSDNLSINIKAMESERSVKFATIDGCLVAYHANRTSFPVTTAEGLGRFYMIVKKKATKEGKKDKIKLVRVSWRAAN